MNVRDLTYVALFAAVMGVLGLMPPIPIGVMPVPITLQTLGVILAGGILGARLGAMSQIVFLLIVATGMPLLSGGRGGLGVFVGPSAGYLLSWPITAFLIGTIQSRFRKIRLGNVLPLNLTVGIFAIYLIGVPVQAFVMDLGVLDVAKASLLFLPGDIIKATIASFLIVNLQKYPVFNRRMLPS
ncbi:biotin transporter BioY [Sporosarcina ureilytica]|uniref:Biotin transporter n=1 Tax=Sporosarcina ureilytica TaxID=298596 RepID=A0A1D8JDE8_9BACL|nr:biotin transporter BioY [Sporosarcina ureilytica]AOV06730.1 biotin transporter BioY [Sporosarcina ureilytica]